jgi:excisionase family DNA binding protein
MGIAAEASLYQKRYRWRKMTMIPQSNTMATNLYSSVPEAARYLGVSRKTVYQLIEWGELNALRLNGAVQIERLSLKYFRNSGKLT